MEKGEILQEIHREIDRNQKGIAKLKELKDRENERIRAAKAYEAHKWARFRAIVKGEKYFKFEHLDLIGVKYDIAIFLSSKNSGKTTAIYEEMARVISRGEKFLYGRVYPFEMDEAKGQFETDENCPVVMMSHGKELLFFRKEDVEVWRVVRMEQDEEKEETSVRCEYPRTVDLLRMGIEPVGKGYTFYKSNTLHGGKYEDYTTIFFDEILSYNPRNMINRKVLEAWGASLSTIARNKKSLRVYMMGNLQPVTSHPILGFYGVSVDDDLRIVKRGDMGECTVLYVNSGGLYSGSWKNQAGVTKHGELEHRAFLQRNKLIKPTPNVLNERIFGEMEYDTALAFHFVPDPYFVELRRVDENGVTVYCLHCSILRMTTQAKGPIQTDDPNVFNRFHNVERRITVERPFNHIARLYRGRTLKFDSMESIANFSMIFSRFKAMEYRHQYGR